MVLITAATKGEVLYPLILAKDATEGQGNPGFAPSDCQEPSIFQKALVTGKLLICTYGFNYIFGGSTLQQLVKTVEAVGAAGVVLVVESDGSGSKFDPVPLRIPAIALLSFADSAVLLLPQLFHAGLFRCLIFERLSCYFQPVVLSATLRWRNINESVQKESDD